MKGSHFSKDILEFIVLLHRHRVKYAIVGGEAVIYYGYARLTGDVDFYYDRTEANVTQLFNALSDFWQGDIPGLTDKEELLEAGMIIQFGLPPNRIDLLNKIDGVHFGEVWRNRTEENIEVENGTIPVYFIGIDSLIKNKQTSARHKDLDDLRFLMKAKEEGELGSRGK